MITLTEIACCVSGIAILYAYVGYPLALLLLREASFTGPSQGCRNTVGHPNRPCLQRGRRHRSKDAEVFSAQLPGGIARSDCCVGWFNRPERPR